MRFLRTTILAIGLTSFAFACGGTKKEVEEPAPAEEMEEEGMEDEMMPDEASMDEDMDDPCAAYDEDNPCGM